MMALALARRARLPQAKACHTPLRSFTRSAPVLKKRRAASSFDGDDLFAPTAQSDDLFSSSPTRSEAEQPPKSSSAFRRPLARKSSKRRDATAGKSGHELFEEHYAFAMDRLGPKPAALHPQVRNSAIRRLLHYSRGPEHIDRILEALARWRNDGRVVDEQTATEIIDRFLAWQPPLILKLLANKPKYGVTLPNIVEARRILRRLVLYRSHPLAQSSDAEAKKKANAEALRNAATFAALLPAHGLGKATDDRMCCALLAQACARNLVFAEALDRKKAEQEGDGNNAESSSTSTPSTKRTPLGAASTRGLLSISSTLSDLLSDHAPPSEPAEIQKRMSGATQSREEERSWIGVALRDVVQALQSVRQSNPSLSSVKTTLGVFEKALQGMNTEKAPLA